MKTLDTGKLFILLIVLLTAISVIQAQVPQKMSYQAVIRDGGGELVTNSSIGIQVSILQGSSEDVVVYTETHLATTNDNGLVSLEIGDGTVVSGSMEEIIWTEGPYFIQTETDLQGGSNYTLLHTSELLSVPYALHARTTEDAVTEAYVNDLMDDVFDILIAAGYAVRDIDGNVYPIVTIGSQVWMTKNLRTTRFNDGTPIPKVEGDSEWSYLNTPAYCWYDNDSVKYDNPYGALYNWYAASSGNICPVGWHVPTENELNTLITYLGGTFIAGGKLKKTGTTYWNSPNEGATNESGFTAIAMGARLYNGSFLDYVHFKNNARFWSATQGPSTPPPGNGVYMILYHNTTNAYISNLDRRGGMSIRCIKD